MTGVQTCALPISVNNYKAEVTTEIKVACIKNAIAEGVDPGAVISFIDNDLKLVMENYFGNIIKIVKSVAVFVSAIPYFLMVCLMLTFSFRAATLSTNFSKISSSFPPVMPTNLATSQYRILGFSYKKGA